jgi:hypothetical protein
MKPAAAKIASSSMSVTRKEVDNRADMGELRAPNLERRPGRLQAIC